MWTVPSCSSGKKRNGAVFVYKRFKETKCRQEVIFFILAVLPAWCASVPLWTGRQYAGMNGVGWCIANTFGRLIPVAVVAG